METSNLFHGCEKNASPWQKQEDKQPQLRWLIGLLWIITISHLYDLFITIPSTQKPSRRCWYTIRVIKKTSKEPNMRTSEKNREFSLWLYIRGTVCHAESTELQAFFSWTCESFAPCILQNHLSILLLMTRCLHRYCHLHGDVPKFR